MRPRDGPGRPGGRWPWRTAVAGLAAVALAWGCASDPQKTRKMLAGFGGVGTIFRDLYDLAPVQEKEEIQIGDGVAATLLGARGLVLDETVQRYVNETGLWIAQRSERPGLPWSFGVTDSDAIGAFATPGGNVLVTRGLMTALRNESELAGVLGHEIAHVVRKDHLSAMRKGAAINLFATGATVAAATAGAGGVGGALAQATKAVYMRGLDRDDEFEADRLGVVYAARAGYDPYALAGVLQTLSAAPDGDATTSFLLDTHPTPADRLQRLSRAMGERFEGCCGQPRNEDGFRRVLALLDRGSAR